MVFGAIEDNLIPADTEWHHAIATYQSDRTMSLFVDGSLIGTRTDVFLNYGSYSDISKWIMTS